MEFKTKIINGKPVVQAIVEKKKNKKGGTDVIVHVPSLKLLNNIK